MWGLSTQHNAIEIRSADYGNPLKVIQRDVKPRYISEVNDQLIILWEDNMEQTYDAIDFSLLSEETVAHSLQVHIDMNQYPFSFEIDSRTFIGPNRSIVFNEDFARLYTIGDDHIAFYNFTNNKFYFYHNDVFLT